MKAKTRGAHNRIAQTHEDRQPLAAGRDVEQTGSRRATIIDAMPSLDVSGMPLDPGTVQREPAPQNRIDRGQRRRLPRFLPDELDRLGDHPQFVLQGANDAGPAGAYSTATFSEEDREATYRFEQLRIFRQRIRLSATIGLYIVPLFELMYWCLSTATRMRLLLAHALLFALFLGARFAAPRLKSLFAVRLSSLVGYVLVCMGAASIAAIASEDPAMGAMPFIIHTAHILIMLSVLLLPYSVWECLVLAFIVVGSFAMTALWTGDETGAFLYSQIFMHGSSALFVLCIAHFQNILRRRAFDSAFDLAHSAAKLQMLSTLDELTGGYNRRHLERVLALEIARAARFAHPLSVVMFDLDNFKRVNDCRGHQAGDEVLREVAQSAAAAIREVDTLARFGGDEFTIVLPETDEAAAHRMAERLQAGTQDSLHARFGDNTPESAVTLSIGLITIYLTEPIPVQSVIEHVDERLYSAKRCGKNRIVD